MVEAEAASRFVKESPSSLAKEYQSASKLVDKWGKVLRRDAETVLLFGNHDWRLYEDGRIPKEYRDLLDPLKHIRGLDKWKTVPYDLSLSGSYQVGKVLVNHGVAAGKIGNKRESVLLGSHISYGLVVRGHDHTPLPVTEIMMTPNSSVSLKLFMANTGTLVQMDPAPKWTNRIDTSDWGPGILLFECVADDRGIGKNWEAELLTP